MQKKSFSRFLTDNIGFLFIVPWLIGFLVFKVYPLHLLCITVLQTTICLLELQRQD